MLPERLTEIAMTRYDRLIIWFAATVSIIVAGCHRDAVTTGAIYSCDAFSLYPDSVTVDGMRVDITAVDTVSPDRGGVFRCDFKVFNDLFNISDTSSGDIQPVDIWLSKAITDPLQSVEALRRRCSPDGFIIVNDSILSRPILSGNPDWIVAAWETGKATGDHNWIKEAADISERSLEIDRTFSFNIDRGLFRGVPVSLATRRGAFPAEMGPIELFETLNLRSNVMYAAAYRALAAMKDKDGNNDGLTLSERYNARADSLCRAINNLMWIPNLGIYSRGLYNAVYPIAAESTDNYGQALAVIHNVSSIQMCRSLIAQTPVLQDRVPVLYPAPDAADEPYSALTCAAWTIASSAAANDNAAAHALAAFTASQLRLPADRRYAAGIRGVLYRGLLGMNLSTEGLIFDPFIPSILTGDKHLAGFHYRKAILDITIHGTGDIISTFAIDGRPVNDFMVPATIEGRHTVTITLAGQSDTRNEITFAQSVPQLPPVPTVTVSNNHTYNISNGVPGEKYMTYLNGMMEEVIPVHQYDLYDDKHVYFVAFAPVLDNRLIGFSNTPVAFVPHNRLISIAAKDIARPGTRIIKDKEISARFVQSTRWKNHSLAFDVAVADSGDYLVSLSYLNGLGIVNPTRKCALRQLTVNGTGQGVFIFPQRLPRDWSHKSDWSRQTSTTNILPVKLHSGINRLSIDYIEAPFSDFNKETNIILIDRITIVNNNP